MMLQRKNEGQKMNSNTSAKASAAEGSAPSWLLLGAEPLRAVCELASAQFMNKSSLPAGDGHPVVLFPGLASDARALAPLKGLCEGLGYATYDWGRGFNTGPEGDIDELLDGDSGLLERGRLGGINCIYRCPLSVRSTCARRNIRLARR